MKSNLKASFWGPLEADAKSTSTYSSDLQFLFNPLEVDMMLNAAIKLRQYNIFHKSEHWGAGSLT